MTSPYFVVHLPASDSELYDAFIALAHGAEHSRTVPSSTA